jgi:hypothetical protein
MERAPFVPSLVLAVSAVDWGLVILEIREVRKSEGKPILIASDSSRNNGTRFGISLIVWIVSGVV